MLVHLGLRLRSRALALRRRAAYEHVIAGISTRLINTQPHEIDTQINRALAELSQLSSRQIVDQRYEKFRRMGQFFA